MANDVRRLIATAWTWRIGAVLAVLTTQGCCGGDTSSVDQDLRRMAKETGVCIAGVYNKMLETVNYDTGQPDYVQDFTPLLFQATRTSPDGRHVGGVTYNYDVDQIADRYRIAVIDLHGAVVWQVPGISARCVAVSPDAEKLAFEGNAGLYSASRYPTGPVKLAPTMAPREPEDNECSLAWSRESDRIVYANTGKVLIYDFRSSKSTVFADGTHPTWSPDGNWIAFRRPDGTAVVRSPDTGMEKIVAGGDKILGSLRWSPDSGYLLYRVRSYRFTNVWASVTTLSGSWTSRLRVYRLRDGASTTIVPALPSNSGEHFGWLKTR